MLHGFSSTSSAKKHTKRFLPPLSSERLPVLIEITVDKSIDNIPVQLLNTGFREEEYLTPLNIFLSVDRLS